MDLTNPRLDDSLCDFLRMSIRLDRDPTMSNDPRPISGRSGRSRSARRRPLPPPEDGVDARRRAFEQTHSQRVTRELHGAQKKWEADERFRKWRNATVSWKPESLTSCRAVDHRVIEGVIGSRNEYYVDMVTTGRSVTMKRSLVKIRPIPRELHAFVEAPANRFYYGA
jgi:hypothetical protein